MKTNLKIFFIIAFNTVIILTTILFLTNIFFVNKANEVDENRVFKGLWRTINTLDSQYSELAKLAADWGEWNDTYNFMEDKNEDYVIDNLSVEAMGLIDIDEIIYVNTNKEVVVGKKADFENEEVLSLSPELEKVLTSDKLLKFNINEKFSGVLFLDDRQVFVAGNPILTTLSKGPSRGSIIMVRYLDDERYEDLSKTLNLELQILPLNKENLPSDVYEKIYTQKDNFVTTPVDNKTYVGYHPVNDVFGELSGVAKIVSDREVKVAMSLGIIYYTATYFVFIIILSWLDYLISKNILAKPLKGGYKE